VQEGVLIHKAITLVENFCETDTLRPYGLDVALNLLALNVDLETILAAILSDWRLLDYPVEAEFGASVASLVSNVTELNRLNIYSKNIATQAAQVEILRRMLLSTADDVRAILIKLAYRLSRLKKLTQEPEEMRHFVAQETLDLYAPIANRLGIGQLKWELEDYAFRYLDTNNYLSVAKALESKRIHREDCIVEFIDQLQERLSTAGLNAEIKGRPKHIFSIWQKMQRKQLPIEELYDLLAVRVMVDEAAQCYEVLGLVHQHWTSIPKEFDDYIAHPKNNGYQSLHTVILTEQANRIEVQIRTKEMHDYAELGVAAHWRYKEGSNQDIATEKSIAALRQLLEETESESLLSNFRTELFSDRVYVLTPAGKLIDLIKGATPLDFAYVVHTDIGHRCRGAKVNGHIVPLTYTLQTGDQVEVLTGNHKEPNANWADPNLAYLKTPRAIQKVKVWIKHQGKSENSSLGEKILDKEAKRLGLKQGYVSKLLHRLKLNGVEKLFAALGNNDVTNTQLVHVLEELKDKQKKSTLKRKVPKKVNSVEITVEGYDNILTHFALCCQPSQGDQVVGFVTHMNGVAIHKADCGNIKGLDEEQKKQLVVVALKQ